MFCNGWIFTYSWFMLCTCRFGCKWCWIVCSMVKGPNLFALFHVHEDVHRCLIFRCYCIHNGNNYKYLSYELSSDILHNWVQTFWHPNDLWALNNNRFLRIWKKYLSSLCLVGASSFKWLQNSPEGSKWCVRFQCTLDYLTGLANLLTPLTYTKLVG